MIVPAVFHTLDTNVTLGLALTAVWLVVLGVNLYKLRQGDRSPERFYMTESIGGVWLAFSLFQISTTFTGIVEKGVVALAVGFFCAGVVTGVRWWRVRNPETASG